MSRSARLCRCCSLPSPRRAAAGAVCLPLVLLALQEGVVQLQKDGLRRRCLEYAWDAPALCPQGAGLWSSEELRAALPAFASLWPLRQPRLDQGAMDLNHAFALWFTARALKPLHVIESGVLRGRSTWLLRQAVGASVPIYSLDPVDPLSLFGYRDDASGKTRYFVGDGFADLAELDWDGLIPAAERSRTLVVLDDHASCLRRVRELLSLGFVHIWFDDNHKTSWDCYSFNRVCSPLPSDVPVVPHGDHYKVSNITAEEHRANAAYLSSHIATYFEFPAVYDGCLVDGHRSFSYDPLVSQRSQLDDLGLPAPKASWTRYVHMHPSYVRLQP